MAEVANRHPEQCTEVSRKSLMHLGQHASYITGGLSALASSTFCTSMAGKLAATELRSQIDKIYANQKLSDQEKEMQTIELLLARGDKLSEQNYKESLAEGNPLAMQVLSGARGNPGNLRSLRAGDLLYTDYRSEPIVVPILHGYSHGLSPVEYFAGAFGTRKGVVDLKLGVPKAGFLSKQTKQIAHRLLVAGLDDEKDSDSIRGWPVETDDPDNEGALLAHSAGNYPRNTVL